MQNKRGQELSTTAIILIILGVLVLVLLIVGFSLGWSKIVPWLSKDNVNDIVNACNTACTTKSVYDFCLRARDMTEGGTDYKNLTCNYIANKMEGDTAKNFGVLQCADLTCTNVELLEKNLDFTKKSDSKNFDICLATDNIGRYIQSYQSTKPFNLASLSCPKTKID